MSTILVPCNLNTYPHPPHQQNLELEDFTFFLSIVNTTNVIKYHVIRSFFDLAYFLFPEFNYWKDNKILLKWGLNAHPHHPSFGV
jgi:hypothetical protein